MSKNEKKEKKQELQKVEPTRSMSPFEEMGQLFERDFFDDMERFFESRLPGRWGGWRHPFSRIRPSFGQLPQPFEGKTPCVDVVEHDKEFLIKAELPGVDKKDIKVTIAGNMVTIEAGTSQEEKEEKGDYYRREISRGAYSRSLMLPVKVKEGEAKASFKSGVLELTIPKIEETKRVAVEVK